MKSELLQRAVEDPKSLSQEEAMTVFTEMVQDIAREQGLDVSSAWVKARQLNPTLYSRLCQGKQPVPADAAERLANDMTPIQLPPPVANNKIFFLLGMKLPASTPDDLFAACWRANGGKATPLNAPDVFVTLVAWLAKKYGWMIERARREAIDFAPALAYAAGESDRMPDPVSPGNLPAAPLPPVTRL